MKMTLKAVVIGSILILFFAFNNGIKIFPKTVKIIDIKYNLTIVE